MDDTVSALPIPPQAPVSEPEVNAPRWFAEWTPEQRAQYADRFTVLAASGQDVDGEARLLDAMISRGARVLDAGCGVGRIAARLSAMGHQAVGVDVDPLLIEAGGKHYPGLPLLLMDLMQLSPERLLAAGLPGDYDLVVCTGNVLHYVADGTQRQIVARLAQLTRPGGRVVFGLGLGRAFTLEDLDGAAVAAGLRRQHRFSTWQCDPYTPNSDWVVSIYQA